MGNLFQVLINALKAKIIPIWTRIKLWTNISFIRTKVFTKIRILFSELFNINVIVEFSVIVVERSTLLASKLELFTKNGNMDKS